MYMGITIYIQGPNILIYMFFNNLIVRCLKGELRSNFLKHIKIYHIQLINLAKIIRTLFF